MKHPEDENIRAAYEVADENGKKMLRALYPDLFTKAKADNRPVTERIKTFEDACDALGGNHPLVNQYNFNSSEMSGWNGDKPADLEAYLKLRIVAAALNESWTPDWNDKQQRKWHPWFYIYSEEEYTNLSEEDKCHVVGRLNYYAVGGIVYANAGYSSSGSHAYSGSRLAFKSKELAEYCGKQFGELWAMFHLG
ncbi:MAG: hypothetical protein HDR99_05730 [Bacteroides sp.]|nr:hypothetical protein [Bacteroides sp.]